MIGKGDLEDHLAVIAEFLGPHSHTQMDRGISPQGSPFHQGTMAEGSVVALGFGT